MPHTPGHEETQANGLIIAAAPDLLAACIAVRMAMPCRIAQDDWTNECGAALSAIEHDAEDDRYARIADVVAERKVRR